MWPPLIALANIVLALIFSAKGSAVKARQKGLTADRGQIVDTVSSLFTAFLTADAAKLDSVIAPDFYIFDGGARFNGEGVMALIKAQHAAGKRHEWNVTEPDIHVSGDTAWIAYVNKGSITDSSGTTNQKWLESAFLQKQMGIWKIVFMHSTRVPTVPQENQRSGSPPVRFIGMPAGFRSQIDSTHTVGTTTFEDRSSVISHLAEDREAVSLSILQRRNWCLGLL